MACPLPADQLKNLKLFIELCKQDPGVLHMTELGFFKSYIESLGGVVPTEKSTDKKKNEKPEMTEPEPEAEEESAESDLEFDNEGVIEPDNDPPQVMGSSDKEVSQEDMDKSDEKKREAIDSYSQGNYEDSIKLYTEAILLNPRSAVLYAKRGQCYLQLMKPNACIRDCSQALEINPDNASAYKFRGRAHRLLGNFLKAAEDLRMACKIDFDEQADEWLKEVTPNAKKIEEHQRKYERKKLEKELRETRDRVKKMREEQRKRAGDAKGDSNSNSDGNGDIGGSGSSGGGGGGMEDILELLKDPETLAAFADPKVVEAFMDVLRSPSNIFKYQDNPNVNKILQKLSAKFGGKIPSGLGRMADGLWGSVAGGSPFGPDGASAAAAAPSPPPPPPPSAAAAADVDLD